MADENLNPEGTPPTGAPQEGGTPPQGNGAPTPAAPQEPGTGGAAEPFTLADLQLAEGVTVAEEDFKAIGEILGTNFSKETAQKLIDFETKRQQSLMSAIDAESTAQRKAWEEAARTDKELGGDKFDENLAAAQEALNALATPALREMLEQTGIGSHPEVVRLFVKLAPLVREPRPGVGLNGQKKEPSRLELLYGATN